MSDYDKLKVTELKTLLKERGIAATGLTKKAQFVQALEEEDAKTGDASAKETAEEVKEDEPAQESKDVVPAEEPDTKDEATAAPSEDTAVAEADAVQTDDKDVTMADADQSAHTDRKRKRDPTPAAEETRESTPKKIKADDPPADREMSNTYDGSTDAPSARPLHPPTAALYIKNLMRPLQLSQFRDHLTDLAQSSSSIVDLHMDSMKTHAFVVFNSAAAAQRVRDSLHDSVWPAESQRKALWVDFIPEDQVNGWIEQEDKASRDARFELVYNEDNSGSTLVSLEEIGGRPQQRQSHGQGVPGAPQGPRGSRQQEYGGQEQRPEPQRAAPPQQQQGQQQQQQQQQGAGFSKLDQYFNFTTSRPKIYFKPVDGELVKQRLDELERETARDWDNGRAWNRSTRITPMDQLRRYTFEDGDKVVDGGVDFGGFGKRQFAGGTGPFIPNGPPRGRGGGRGGYRGGY